MAETDLKRGLGLSLLTLYGLGTTIGAGIYVLLGAVTSISGLLTPVAFLLATILAGFSALTFAEFSVRLPFSAGEAIYVKEGFRKQGFATLVGLMVVASGTVSSSAMISGFIGYFSLFADLSPWLTILLVTGLLCAIACWGVVESVAIAALVTLLEIGGLIFVVIAAWPEFVHAIPRLPELIEQQGLEMGTVWAGAALAFYALIGFEDMVNVAEEVDDVSKTLPRAIMLTLGITGILYFVIAFVAVSIVPLDQLASSQAPMADLYERATGQQPYVIGLIGIFAVVNGALIQMIMSARIIYGLSRRGHLPAIWNKVNPVTHTPVRATIFVSAIILVLAALLPLVTLAQFTSVITLAVFTIVNLALVVVKRRGGKPPAFIVPMWVPVFGAAISAVFVFVQITELIRSD
jgi:APA family basic amino acid/polyamine antiporter